MAKDVNHWFPAWGTTPRRVRRWACQGNILVENGRLLVLGIVVLIIIAVLVSGLSSNRKRAHVHVPVAQAVSPSSEPMVNSQAQAVQMVRSAQMAQQLSIQAQQREQGEAP